MPRVVLLAVLLLALAAPAHAERVGGDGGPVAALHEQAVTLRAVAGHVVLERERDRVRFEQVYVIVAEEATPAAPGAPWIELPEAALEVAVARGAEQLRPVPGGLELHRELPSGRLTLSFSFELEAPGGEAVMAHALPFPVENVHLVWLDGVPLSARAMGFTDTGTVTIRGRPMRVLERARPIAAGERLAVVTTGEAASGRPVRRARAGAGTRDPLGPLGSLTLVLAVLLLVVGLLLPSRLRLRQTGPAGSPRG